jgi:hypothetical protein
MISELSAENIAVIAEGENHADDCDSVAINQGCLCNCTGQQFSAAAGHIEHLIQRNTDLESLIRLTTDDESTEKLRNDPYLQGVLAAVTE